MKRSLSPFVSWATIALVSVALTTISRAQQDLPIDTHAIFKTHAPHSNSSKGGGSGSTKPGRGGGGGGGSSSGGVATFTGTPYSVGITITPTTTRPEAEEHIAVDPNDSSNLVAAISDFALRGGWNTTKYAFSSDNGTTWTESYVPLDASGFPTTGDGLSWQANSDPVVAIDKLGNAYLANLYFDVDASGNATANGLYVSVGTIASGVKLAASNTFAVASNPDSTVQEDKEWITVDNSSSAYSGNVYVSWTRFVGTSDYIVFSRSLNHGQSWSTPIQISPTTQNGGVQGSQIAVGPDGSIYVVYEVFFVGGVRQQYLVKSTNGGVSFGSAVAISPQFSELSFNSTYRKNSFASLAVNPASGYVYVVYANQAGTAGAEVEFIKSSSAGATTFTSPLRINDNSTGQQFFPAVTSDSAGNIHVSWFDTRNSGGSTSTYDVYATESPNNGGSFTPNARVTPSQVNAGSASFIGDYAGIAAANHSAHPVWTSGGFNNGALQTATLSF